MGFVHSFFFFLLLLLSVCMILSADVSKDHPKCSPFTCGKLGELSFPFYGNNTDPYCGFCHVDCSTKPVQKIQLVEGGRWFEVNSLSQSNSLLLTDPLIKKQLTSSSCDVFTSLNLSASGPLISFMIRDNQTLFKCKSSLNISIPENIRRHKCGKYDIYYGLINSSINSSPLESQCSVIQLPVDKSSRESNIFSILTATFYLDMFIPPDCFDCHYKGGRCEATDNRNHKCNNGNEATLIRNEAEEVNNNPSYCPQTFSCGKLDDLNFPYSKFEDDPTCGLLYVKDCSEQVQWIQLEKNGRWYIIEDISEANTMTIFDPLLQEHINSSSCKIIEDLSPPSSPLFQPKATSLENIFMCNQTLPITPKDFNYERCKDEDYSVYYSLVSNTSSTFPSECSKIQLPIDRRNNRRDLFSILSARYHLTVTLPNGCRRCHHRGVQCKLKSKDKFECVGDGKGDTKLGVKLGIGIGGPLILLIIISSLFMLWHCYRKKHASPRYVPRNISSRSDLEGGSVYYKVPIFSYSELEKVTGNFDSDKLLGDGGFGTVYYGELPDGREVAVKRLYEHNFRRVEQFMNEIEILTKLQHKNLVVLYGCTSRRSRELLLVYEFVPNGTVADNLYGDTVKASSLTWPIRMSIAIETASALAYLHASGIIHRDVKTNNILLDNNFSVKVADFGLSRLFPLDVTHISTAPQGTPGYVDPEYHQCYQLTNKSDVYSFGVVLTELISSMPAVDINRHRHEINLANLAINRIQKCAFNELIDPSLGYESDQEVRRMTTSVAELAFRCLQQDKEMRPAMDEVWEELKRIQTGEYKLDNPDEGHENEVMKSTRPSQSSPEYAEASLLKNNRVPPSPVSVTHKWLSDDTTPNTSAYSPSSA